jgi:16S rRNA (guanine527-N7)-methyltransferase
VIPSPQAKGSVSRETEAQLAAFAALVTRWNPTINLIAASTLPDIETRHISDSAQLLPLAPPGWTHWADLGSGAGFPGIVIAILARDSLPDTRVTLVESDQRKATFLRTAIRTLDLRAQVLATRAEAAPPLQADVLSARALAPLAQLLPLAHRHLTPLGRALFPKGRRAASEIPDARHDWNFTLTEHTSQTDPEGRIFQIEGITHV